MSTIGWHGGSMKLSDIRNDLENLELTPTQRKAAFEHLRRWLRERPDDTEAMELWDRFESEFGREDADMPIGRDTSGEGFEALSEAWEPQARALPGADVAAPVLYGLGSTFDEQAEALLAQLGDDELVPVGAGMGGFCALALTARAPDRVPGLVLVGTSPAADSPERRAGRDELIELLRSEGTARLWDEVGADLFPDGAPPHVVERAREIALEQDPDQLLDALHAMRDRSAAAALAADFTGALLVAVGDRDPLVPLDEAGELARSVPGGRLEVFAGAGHLPSLEQPDRFTPVLTDFLSPWL